MYLKVEGRDEEIDRLHKMLDTENQNQVGICPFALREVSVLAEPTLGLLFKSYQYLKVYRMLKFLNEGFS